MGNITVSKILGVSALNDELEYEKATALFLKLRLLVKKDPSLNRQRKHLKSLIASYEKEKWSNIDELTDDQINKSDLAEKLIEAENLFFSKRKTVIKNRLKEMGLNQTELGEILGHGKGYMSELINGVRPMSKDDMIVLNRLLGIPYEDLIPSFIKREKAEKIKAALARIGKNKITIQSSDLDLQIV